MGVKNSKLGFKDLCCVSISNRRLNRLSSEDTLWHNLLTLDFSNNSSSSSQAFQFKSLYKSSYEKEKSRKLAAYNRAVLRVESQIFVHTTKIKLLRSQLMDETQRLNSTSKELSHLHIVRTASVALNVWQPDIVRYRQKQVVEQCTVPIESRIRALEMEYKLCKQQIAVFEKAYRDEKQRLDTTKKQLESMKYHSLRDYKLAEKIVDQNIQPKKKLKTSSESSTSTSK